MSLLATSLALPPSSSPLSLTTSALPTFSIVAATVLAVIVRPWRLPEPIAALIGALLLCMLGLLPWRAAWHAVGEGSQVYLFLAGMMLVAEVARSEGVFDALAAIALRLAGRSTERLLLLVYAVGVVVTVFMSNDATAVVLTPAVLAVTRAARITQPLPYLYACAFVANAASFVLPISNPANLVVFHQHLPPLLDWLARFALPSVVAIVATYLLLRFTQRAAMAQRMSHAVTVQAQSVECRLAGGGVLFMAMVMLTASAADIALGWPTFLAGLAVFAALCLRRRRVLMSCLREISWSMLLLVAGLFVLVEALQQSGVVALLSRALHNWIVQTPDRAAWYAAGAATLAGNLANNLPVGLLTGAVVGVAQPPQPVTSALLVAVDLGPNWSVTGSLATMLWLAAVRREKVSVSALDFLKVGTVVTLPTLIATLWSLLR